MHIELKGITKRFGALTANDSISLSVPAGQIVGILGENGAGKSTLMKILSGFQPADSGEIWLDGRHVVYRGASQAVASGIGMLQQDPLDVGALSVLENFRFGNPALKQPRQRLLELAQRFGFDLNPDQLAEQLSIAQRQQLEIVRLLALGVRVLILDEPTTGISAQQKHLLFATLRHLAAEGMVVLLVSHKLEDVIALCHSVAVLRAGQLVGTLPMPATTQQLVALMFGAPMADLPPHHANPVGDLVLELRDVVLRGRRIHLEPLALSVRAGEVIGLAGMDGSGQELLLRACTGVLKPQRGQVVVQGRTITGAPYREFLARGYAFAAAGRLEEGLIAGLTLTEHVALVSEQGAWVDWQAAEAQTRQRIAGYQVRGQAHSRIEQLSGGNQQRVLMSLLPEAPRLLALEQPTRGLDVDSARWIWQRLEERRQRGAAILFSSAELDEIVAYSDRVLVFYNGRVVEVNDPAHISSSTLGHYIGGNFS